MDETINIVMLGSGKVDKTAIALQYIKGEFTESFIPTIEDEFEKNVTIDDIPYKIVVVDTAGQEDFKDLRAKYIREGNCFMLIYAVDDEISFNFIQEIYDDIMVIHKKTLPPCIIVGNKCELPLPHAVTLEQAQAYSKQHFQNIPVVEVSSKTNKNITESFEKIIRIYIERYLRKYILERINNQKVTRFLKKYYESIKRYSQKTTKKHTHFSQKIFQNIFKYLNNEKGNLNIINSFNYSIIHQNQLLIFSNQGHQTNIFKAIRKNDFQSVQFLIENDFYSVYDVNKSGKSLLNYCLENEKEKIYNYLLSKQTPLNYFEKIENKPKDFESDIFKACETGKLTSVQWLIEKEKVNKSIKDDYKNTPIHYASKNGHLPIVQYLIEIQNIDKDIKGLFKNTPLHYACEKGHLPIVKYLISKGANIESKSKFEIKPLDLASHDKHTDVVNYLISQRASKI